MLKFILASTNEHKVSELNELLKGSVLVEKAVQKLEVEETGDTFMENALIKAQAYYERFKKPVISDDSGLVVTSFPDLLGVRSARFAPESEDYKEKCEKVLKLFSPEQDRGAYFVCQLCCYFSADKVYFFEGRLTGKIAHEYRGKGGFGYDPIFIPDEGEGEQSLAELSEWKKGFSHRAKAAHEAIKFLQASQGG